ncbi:MAG: hypothetical protein ACYDG2_22850 [Ruminiclostridium sp.]
MIRRVLAWVLLAGFVLLLLNIVMFHYFLGASILVYLIIAIWFMFTNKPLPSRKKKKAENITEEDTEGDKENTIEEVSEGLAEESIVENITKEFIGEPTEDPSKEPREEK